MGRPIVVFAHNFYRENSETYRSTEKDLVETVVEVPLLKEEGLLKIMEKKVKAVSKESALSEVFEEDALKQVYTFYDRNKRIRDSIRVCRESIETASDKDADKVTSAIVSSRLV